MEIEYNDTIVNKYEHMQKYFIDLIKNEIDDAIKELDLDSISSKKNCEYIYECSNTIFCYLPNLMYCLTSDSIKKITKSYPSFDIIINRTRLGYSIKIQPNAEYKKILIDNYRANNEETKKISVEKDIEPLVKTNNHCCILI